MAEGPRSAVQRLRHGRPSSWPLVVSPSLHSRSDLLIHLLRGKHQPIVPYLRHVLQLDGHVERLLLFFLFLFLLLAAGAFALLLFLWFLRVRFGLRGLPGVWAFEFGALVRARQVRGTCEIGGLACLSLEVRADDRGVEGGGLQLLRCR